MNDSYFGPNILKAGPKVLQKVRITDNVQSTSYNTRLSGKDLLNHYKVYGAIIIRDIWNNEFNFHICDTFQSHQTPRTVLKFLPLCETKVTQALIMCSTKNVAEWEKNNWQVHFAHQQSVISRHLQYIDTTTVQNILALQYIHGFCQIMQLHQ